jgi:hypothetical protein
MSHDDVIMIFVMLRCVIERLDSSVDAVRRSTPNAVSAILISDEVAESNFVLNNREETKRDKF